MITAEMVYEDIMKIYQFWLKSVIKGIHETTQAAWNKILDFF